MSSFFLLFHHWNALLCPPIGFFLNLLLLWLILHRTPKDMWVHSRVLLQTCILDILLLIVMSMGGHLMVLMQSLNVIYIFDGYFIGFYQKLWGDNVQDGLQLLMLLSFGFYNWDTQSISTQFLYRYLVLNRDIKIGLGFYLLLLFPSLLFNLAFFSTMPLIFSRIGDLSTVESELISHGLMDSEEKPVYFAYHFKGNLSNFESELISHLLMDSEEKPVYIVFQFKFPNFIFWQILFIFPKSFFYAIIIFCGHRMVRHVAAHAMTERLKELNRQLSRNLIVLATYPLIMDLIICSLVNISGLISISNELSLYVQLFLIQMIYWFAVINPVISMWTFRPYREAIRSAICCKFKISPGVN